MANEVDTNSIIDNLTELLQNTVNMTSVFYDIFINPEPMDVVLTQYNTNGELITITVPNRAKDLQRALVGTGSPEGTVAVAEGTLYVDSVTQTAYVKIDGSGTTGWKIILTEEGIYAYVRNYLLEHGYYNTETLERYLTENEYVKQETVQEAVKDAIKDSKLVLQRNNLTIGTYAADQTITSTINISVPTTASDVGALPDTTFIPKVVNVYSATGTDAISGRGVAQAINGLIKKTDLSAIYPITYNSNTGVIGVSVNTEVTDSFTDIASSGAVKNYVDNAIVGGVLYQGVWNATGQTDYSSIILPVKKGFLYYVQGSTTVDGIDWSTGDFLLINEDVAEEGTITDVSKIDNTESTDIVRLNANQTLTNKTMSADSNSIINLTTSNLKSGILVTSVRDTATASNTVLASELGIANALTLKADKTEIPTKVSELTNDTGFITSISSVDVTTALGYTPQEVLVQGTGITISGNTISATGTTIPIDATMSTTSTNPVQNKVISAALEDKQDVLTAGTGITISGNTISATGTTIPIDTTMSTTSTNPVQNKVISVALEDKQDVLTAGTGIAINNNTISATGTTTPIVTFRNWS
jgi:hypothetical protein